MESRSFTFLLALLALLVSSIYTSCPRRELSQTQNFFQEVPPPDGFDKIELVACVQQVNGQKIIVCTGTSTLHFNGGQIQNMDKFLVHFFPNGTENRTVMIGNNNVAGRVEDALGLTISTSGEIESSGCANTTSISTGFPDGDVDAIRSRSAWSSSAPITDRYGSTDNATEISNSLASFTSGSTVLGIKSIPESGNSSSVLQRIDSNGDIEKALIISDPLGGTYFSDMKTDGNETLLTVQYVSTPDVSSAIHAFESPLTHKWSKRIEPVSPDYSSIQINSILYTGDGFVLVGNASKGTQDTDLFVCKISADGTVLWSKVYKVGNNSYKEVGMHGSLTDSGDILISGYSATINSDQEYPLLARLNADGEVQWAHSLNSLSQGSFYRGVARTIFELHDGGIFLGGHDDFSSNTFSSFIARLGSDGSLNTPTHASHDLTQNGFTTSDVSVSMTSFTPNMQDYTSKMQRREPITDYYFTNLLPTVPLDPTPTGGILDDQVSVGTILGIAIGCLVFISVVIVVAILVVKCRRKKNNRIKVHSIDLRKDIKIKGMKGGKKKLNESRGEFNKSFESHSGSEGDH